MSIVTRMKADRIVARATDKGAFALLTNVLGDYDLARTQKQNLTKGEDEILIPIVKIHMSRAQEELSALRNAAAPMHRIDRAMMDAELLERYLPELLTEADLRKIADAFLLSGQKMPDMMKHLKAEFANLYDGKQASAIAKEILG